MSGLGLFIRGLQRLLLLCLNGLRFPSGFPRGGSLDCCLVDVDPKVAEHLIVYLGYELRVVVRDDRLLEFLQAHHLSGLLALAHQLGVGGLGNEGGLDLLLHQAVHVDAFEERVGEYLVASSLSA